MNLFILHELQVRQRSCSNQMGRLTAEYIGNLGKSKSVSAYHRHITVSRIGIGLSSAQDMYHLRPPFFMSQKKLCDELISQPRKPTECQTDEHKQKPLHCELKRR